jgi:hypothetical protein
MAIRAVPVPDLIRRVALRATASVVGADCDIGGDLSGGKEVAPPGLRTAKHFETVPPSMGKGRVTREPIRSLRGSCAG